MKPIAIVDYGMGNLRSVQKAFEKVGHPAAIVADPAQIADADKLVLPGVGAFRDAIARIRQAGFAEPIIDHIRANKPFLGICLGMQLLFTKSYEDGEHLGLGIFEGAVVRFPDRPGVKVPHMGWNDIRIRRRAAIFRDIADGSFVYFVHSYYAAPADRNLIASETDYPEPFTSAICSENVFAMQFHPEKSQAVGLAMLANFAAL
jgi:glutamine amidotransferase